MNPSNNGHDQVGRGVKRGFNNGTKSRVFESIRGQHYDHHGKRHGLEEEEKYYHVGQETLAFLFFEVI